MPRARRRRTRASDRALLMSTTETLPRARAMKTRGAGRRVCTTSVCGQRFGPRTSRLDTTSASCVTAPPTRSSPRGSASRAFSSAAGCSTRRPSCTSETSWPGARRDCLPAVGGGLPSTGDGSTWRRRRSGAAARFVRRRARVPQRVGARPARREPVECAASVRRVGRPGSRGPGRGGVSGRRADVAGRAPPAAPGQAGILDPSQAEDIVSLSVLSPPARRRRPWLGRARRSLAGWSHVTTRTSQPTRWRPWAASPLASSTHSRCRRAWTPRPSTCSRRPRPICSSSRTLAGGLSLRPSPAAGEPTRVWRRYRAARPGGADRRRGQELDEGP